MHFRKSQRITVLVIASTAAFCAAVILLVEQSKEDVFYAQVESEFNQFANLFNEQNFACYLNLEFDDPMLRKIKSNPHVLNLNYEPGDLVPIPSQYLSSLGAGSLVRENTLGPTLELITAAASSSHKILVNSAYRNSARQTAIVNNPFNQRSSTGFDKAALPGASEHQLGTAVDLSASPAGYEWVAENAHLYGFTVSYPEGAEEQTGFVHEPWHLRYVGVEIATDLKDRALPVNETNKLFLPAPDSVQLLPVSYTGSGFEILMIDGENQKSLQAQEENFLDSDLVNLASLIIAGEDIPNLLADGLEYQGYAGYVWKETVVIVHKIKIFDQGYVYGFAERDSDRFFVIGDRNEQDQIKEIIEVLSDRCF